MAMWMLYALAPGLALSCAAVLAEQGARQRRWAGRWIWLAAMLASILLPALGPAVPAFAPFRLSTIAPSVATFAPPVNETWVAVAPAQGPTLARVLWAALSIAMLIGVLGSAALLRHRARRWRRAVIDGSETYVAPSAGPAVFGWWRPRIVLPAWLADVPTHARALAIAHEQSHLDARDPQLLGFALLLLAIMPWNPALWWQCRRLRHAIEVDCDARVLRRGHDVVDYGEALLALGLRRSQRHGLMAASDSSQTLLERRIRIMSSQPNQWSRVTAGILVGLALCTVAVAAELSPARDPAVKSDASNASTDLVAPPAPPAPRAPHAPLALSQLPALPAPPAPPAHMPALAAVAPLPPVPPVAARAPLAAIESDEGDSAEDAVENAKAEAEEAAERAAELKNDAEEADKAAKEAMQDALEQQKQAEDAKREAEAAAAEAMARKQAAEAAAHSPQSSNRVN